MRDIVAAHNGMTDAEQPEIPLYTHRFQVEVALPVDVAITADLIEQLSDAVHGCFPICEDGDTVVRLQPEHG